MLNNLDTCRVQRVAHRQQGVVLFLALIVLVAMMLGGIALFRSMDIATISVGNISMQRNATRSGDSAVEAAVTWLTAQGNGLFNDAPANGYMAAGMSPGATKGANQTWADYWQQLASVYTPISLTEDAAGNTASYLIQRLCTISGRPYSGGSGAVPAVSCVEPPAGIEQICPTPPCLTRVSGTYYRILVRTTGPRGVVSFLQVMLFIE